MVEVNDFDGGNVPAREMSLVKQETSATAKEREIPS